MCRRGYFRKEATMPRETDTAQDETRKDAAGDRSDAPNSEDRRDDRPSDVDHRFRDWALI
jgi:hypothetical protein